MLHNTTLKVLLPVAFMSLLQACGNEPDMADPTTASSTNTQASLDNTSALEVTQQAASLSGKTGYLVKIHTCDLDNSGTGSLIDMSMQVRDANWEVKTLGNWLQNHTHREGSGEYNDHENNQTDVYFYPESTRAHHIEWLLINSDGAGRKPGWCWDRMTVTRVENGAAGWTWTYAGTNWVFGGTYSYNFVSGHSGEPLPADARTPGSDSSDETGGSMYNAAASLVYSEDVLPGDSCPEGAVTLRDDPHTLPMTLVGFDRKHTGGGTDLCEYFTTFYHVPVGWRKFVAIRGGRELGSTTVNLAPSNWPTPVVIRPQPRF